MAGTDVGSAVAASVADGSGEGNSVGDAWGDVTGIGDRAGAGGTKMGQLVRQVPAACHITSRETIANTIMAMPSTATSRAQGAGVPTLRGATAVAPAWEKAHG